MFRALILMCFTYFFYHLHASGDISKYINMKYSYISHIAIFTFILLTFVQFMSVARGSDQDDACNCQGHSHESMKDKPLIKRLFHYGIFLFPLVTGLFFPIATLDSTIVKSKGFSFQAIDELAAGDEYAQTQYLRPDTSIYYGEEGYKELMDAELEEFSAGDHIVLTSENFLKGMEIIYNYPGEFRNKTIEYDGFTFNGESIDPEQVFVLRFGIIHCIADSGAYGMLVEFPEGTEFEDDEWIHVKGTLSTMYYQPFKANIPVLKVEEWETIKEPADPYTYRTY